MAISIIKTSGAAPITSGSTYDPAPSGSDQGVASLFMYRSGGAGATSSAFSLNGVNFAQDISIVSQSLISFNMYATAGSINESSIPASGTISAAVSTSNNGRGGVAVTVAGMQQAAPVVSDLQIQTFANSSMPSLTFNATTGDLVLVMYESNGGSLNAPANASSGDSYTEQADGALTGSPLSQGKIYSLVASSDLTNESVGNWLSGSNSGTITLAVFTGIAGGGSLSISTNNSLSSQASDNLTLTTQAPAASIVAANSLNSTSANNLDLSAAYPLETNSALSATASSNLSLVSHSAIAVDDSVISTSANTVFLSANAQLIISDGLNSQASSNLDLIAHSSLIVSFSTNNQSTDNLTLATNNPAGTITINSAVSGQSTNDLDLIANSPVAIDSSVNQQASSNLTLSTNSQVSINNCVSQSSSDNVSLLSRNSLDINDCTSAQTTDNVTLTANSTVQTNNSSSAHSAQNCNVYESGVIKVDNSSHSHLSNVVSFAAYSLKRTIKATSQSRTVVTTNSNREFLSTTNRVIKVTQSKRQLTA